MKTTILTIGLCIAIGLVLFFIISIPFAIKSEKKEFNNGYCPRCHARLNHADTDSQGGRLYTCPDCGKYSTWISYHCVDREYQKEELRKYYAEDGLGDRYGNKLD